MVLKINKLRTGKWGIGNNTTVLNWIPRALLWHPCLTASCRRVKGNQGWSQTSSHEQPGGRQTCAIQLPLCWEELRVLSHGAFWCHVWAVCLDRVKKRAGSAPGPTDYLLYGEAPKWAHGAPCKGKCCKHQPSIYHNDGSLCPKETCPRRKECFSAMWRMDWVHHRPPLVSVKQKKKKSWKLLM